MGPGPTGPGHSEPGPLGLKPKGLRPGGLAWPSSHLIGLRSRSHEVHGHTAWPNEVHGHEVKYMAQSIHCLSDVSDFSRRTLKS